MASGGPPDALTPRHEYAATLVAAGWRNGDVCQEVGLSIGRLVILKSSPLFQTLVEQRKQQLTERLIGNLTDVTKRLHAEAGPTLDVLTELRDTAKAEVRLGAANSLADRIPALAKRTLHEEERRIVITFGDRELAEMGRVAAEFREPRRLAAPILEAPAVAAEPEAVPSLAPADAGAEA